MTYQLSDQAHPLHALRVDVDHQVASAHPSMQDAARIAANRHNAAIDLLTGSGDYAADWAAPVLDDSGRPVLRENSAGQFQVALDSLCITFRSLSVPFDRPDAAAVQRDVVAIAKLDTAHPVAKHYGVLLNRCIPVELSPDWPEVSALVGV